MPPSSNACNTPKWAIPRAAPPDKTMAKPWPFPRLIQLLWFLYVYIIVVVHLYNNALYQKVSQIIKTISDPLFAKLHLKSFQSPFYSPFLNPKIEIERVKINS
jgi:hypothetical protein